MFGQPLLYPTIPFFFFFPTIPFIALDRKLASVNSSYLIESMTLGKEMWEMGRRRGINSEFSKRTFPLSLYF